MVSVKLKFKPSKIEGKEGSLFYQLIYLRKVRQINTKFKIMSDEWDSLRNFVGMRICLLKKLIRKYLCLMNLICDPMYVARHSWVSIARDEGIPISVISEGMVHDSESTTKIYLASLETQVIDKANKKIL